MANETTFATLEGRYAYDYLLLAEAALSARYENDNVRQNFKTADIGSQPTDSARFVKKPTLTASGLTDGTDLITNTVWQPDVVTLAVGEAGLKITLTDLGRSGSYASDMELAGEAGKAVLEKITTDCCSLGGGFSTVVGSTGVNLTELNIEEALIALMGNRAPGDLFGVLHPVQWWDLINDIGTTVFSGQMAPSDPAMVDRYDARPGGLGGRVMGIDFYVNSLVPTANAGADRAGFIAVKNRTLGMVNKWFIRPEMERDASLRGTETVVTACYAVGEIEDATGVGVVTDA